MAKMLSHHRAVLVELADGYSPDEPQYCSFAHLTRSTGLDRATVRRVCRHLARRGLAEYARGLWNDDGEPRGSGYTATAAGYLLVRSEATEALPQAAE